MTTATTTLTDFLLARIDEDESEALRLAAEADHWHDDGPTSPARVLAECEAKRRIAEWAETSSGEFHWGSVLEPLAAVYADHPDFREEWRL